MNVLDIAQNSVDAGASLIQISLCIATAQKRMTLTIADNGRGMPAEFAARVTDPFCTSRTSRRVGLGLPFLRTNLAIATAAGINTVRAKGMATFGLVKPRACMVLTASTPMFLTADAGLLRI